MLKKILFLLAFVQSANAQLTFPSLTHSENVNLGQSIAVWDCTFRNVSGHDVNIVEIKTYCGCTSAGLNKHLWRQGESGVINIRMKISKDAPAVAAQQIDVLTDGGVYRLNFFAHVRRPIILSPRMLIWTAGVSDARDVLISIDPALDLHPIGLVNARQFGFDAKIIDGKEPGQFILRIAPPSPSRIVNAILIPQFSKDPQLPYEINVYASVR